MSPVVRHCLRIAAWMGLAALAVVIANVSCMLGFLMSSPLAYVGFVFAFAAASGSVAAWPFAATDEDGSAPPRGPDAKPAPEDGSGDGSPRSSSSVRRRGLAGEWVAHVVLTTVLAGWTVALVAAGSVFYLLGVVFTIAAFGGVVSEWPFAFPPTDEASEPGRLPPAGADQSGADRGARSLLPGVPTGKPVPEQASHQPVPLTHPETQRIVPASPADSGRLRPAGLSVGQFGLLLLGSVLTWWASLLWLTGQGTGWLMVPAVSGVTLAGALWLGKRGRT